MTEDNSRLIRDIKDELSNVKGLLTELTSIVETSKRISSRYRTLVTEISVEEQLMKNFKQEIIEMDNSNDEYTACILRCIWHLTIYDKNNNIIIEERNFILYIFNLLLDKNYEFVLIGFNILANLLSKWYDALLELYYDDLERCIILAKNYLDIFVSSENENMDIIPILSFLHNASLVEKLVLVIINKNIIESMVFLLGIESKKHFDYCTSIIMNLSIKKELFINETKIIITSLLKRRPLTENVIKLIFKLK